MSSPECYRPKQAAPREHSGQVQSGMRMEQVITYLAAAQAMKLEQAGSAFVVAIPNRPQRWLIDNMDGDHIGVTRCQVDEADRLSADLDMIFQITPQGWEPVELVHTEQAWAEFAQAMAAQHRPLFDAQGNFSFLAFTDYWAQQLAQQAALAQADRGIVDIYPQDAGKA